MVWSLRVTEVCGHGRRRPWVACAGIGKTNLAANLVRIGSETNWIFVSAGMRITWR